MIKYPRQVKDDVSRRLNDERINPLDIETENDVINMLVGELQHGKWKPHWQSPGFAPSENVSHCLEILEAAGFEKWGLECIEKDVTYKAWSGSEESSVLSFSASRALLLSLWTAWRMEHDGDTE